MKTTQQRHKDKLVIEVYDNRTDMGTAAAEAVVARILGLMSTQDEINMVFAAAPSQNEFLAALASDPRVDWGRINAFHLDEYIGLAPDAPQGFGQGGRIGRDLQTAASQRRLLRRIV